MNRAIMIMGVSGAGKSTVGVRLAGALDGVFVEGDDYHPPENIAQMKAGQPLTESLRLPWLDLLSAAVQVARLRHDTVFTCSALKESHRARLRAAIPALQVVYLHGAQAIIRQRLEHREDHFMPASQLEAQFSTLEPPTDCLSIGIDQPVESLVQRLKLRL